MSGADVIAFPGSAAATYDALIDAIGPDLTPYVLVTEGGFTVLAFEIETDTPSAEALKAALIVRQRFSGDPGFREHILAWAVGLGTYLSATPPGRPSAPDRVSS